MNATLAAYQPKVSYPTQRKTNLSPHSQRGSIRKLLLPLIQLAANSRTLRAESAGVWRCGNESYFLPRFVFAGDSSSKKPIRFALFAGLAGDDLGAIFGLTSLIRALATHPAIGREYELVLYPLCNPAAYTESQEAIRHPRFRSRESLTSKVDPALSLMEAELRQQAFDGIISLHKGEARNCVRTSARDERLKMYILRPALAAAEQVMPPADREQLKGFYVVPNPADTKAESETITNPPFEIALEIADCLTMRMQAQVYLIVLHAILANYRRLATAEGGSFRATSARQSS